MVDTVAVGGERKASVCLVFVRETEIERGRELSKTKQRDSEREQMP